MGMRTPTSGTFFKHKEQFSDRSAQGMNHILINYAMLVDLAILFDCRALIDDKNRVVLPRLTQQSSLTAITCGWYSSKHSLTSVETPRESNRLQDCSCVIYRL